MDDLLRCPICFDYFNTAMILPACSHNYCSLCINRYWSFSAKLECPSCRNPTESTEIKPNRILDQLVFTFKSESSSNSSSSSILSESPQKSIAIASLKRKPGHDLEEEEPTPKVSKTLNTRPPQNLANSSVSNEIVIVDDEPTTPTTLPNTNLNMLSLGGAKFNSNSSSSNSKIQCPVCFSMVPSSTIEYHVNRCITGGLASKQKENPFFMRHDEHLTYSPKKRTPIRTINGTEYKSMGKLCYNIMNDKELRSYLRKVQLPSTGDRSLLIKRHKEFVLRWNAECDKLYPSKTQDEIAKDVLSLEKYGGFDVERQVNSIKVTDKVFEELTSQVKRRRSKDSCTPTPTQNLSTSTSTEQIDFFDSPSTPQKYDILTERETIQNDSSGENGVLDSTETTTETTTTTSTSTIKSDIEDSPITEALTLTPTQVVIITTPTLSPSSPFKPETSTDNTNIPFFQPPDYIFDSDSLYSLSSQPTSPSTKESLLETIEKSDV